MGLPRRYIPGYEPRMNPLLCCRTCLRCGSMVVTIGGGDHRADCPDRLEAEKEDRETEAAEFWGSHGGGS